MTQQFAGKVALITGGASGIGRASALAFAAEGAHVVVADVNTPGGEETVEMIRAHGGTALFVRTDISQAADVEALIDHTIATYGRLDYAHNNAGIMGGFAPTADWTEAQWDAVMNVNLKGTWLCMKYEIAQMLKQGSGAIVNTASSLSVGAFPTLVGYVTSKHGIIGLTKTAALDYARAGIRINAICPGLTDTPMFRQSTQSDTNLMEQALAREPLGRAAQPSEMAAAAIWLCSPVASFVNGHAMIVDGGRTVQV